KIAGKIADAALERIFHGEAEANHVPVPDRSGSCWLLLPGAPRASRFRGGSPEGSARANRSPGRSPAGRSTGTPRVPARVGGRSDCGRVFAGRQDSGGGSGPGHSPVGSLHRQTSLPPRSENQVRTSARVFAGWIDPGRLRGGRKQDNRPRP